MTMRCFIAAMACAAAAGGGARAAEAPWRLGETVSRALAQHPAVREAAGQGAAASARLRAARADLLPALGWQSSAVQQGPTVQLASPAGPMEVVPDRRWDVRLGIDYLLLDGGGRRARIAQGTAGVGAAAAQESAVREQVAAGAAMAHLAVLRARDQLGVAREARGRQEEHRRLAATRFELGAVAKLDLLRADADLAAARADEVAALNAVAIAEASFNRAVGRPADAPVSLAPLVPTELAALPSQAESLEQALAAHPEFAALSERQKLALAQAREARSERRPRLRLTGSVLQQTETAFSKGNSWSAGLAVSHSLWDGGRSRSREEAARADAEAVDAGVERLRQDVAVAVRQALLEETGARARLQSAEEEVAASEEGLRVARIAYEAGLRTSVEVTDAQVALTRARTRRVNALYDTAQARVAWSYAVGGAAGLADSEL